MTDAEVRVIACDESASEGENLIASRHPVFVHASVNLTMEDAVELLDAMRVAMHAQAPEMKSKTALAPSNRPALMDALERLSGAANICLVDKAYFLTSKLIALLIAAQASEEGMNIGELGYARDYADYLDQNAAEAVGQGDRFGSLRPGSRADLVILNRDIDLTPPGELKDVKPLLTMAGGKITFQAASGGL